VNMLWDYIGTGRSKNQMRSKPIVLSKSGFMKEIIVLAKMYYITEL